MKYSYRYLSIQEYLIDKIAWRENRNNLIKDAGLEDLADYNKVMNELKRLLNEKYEIYRGNKELKEKLKKKHSELEEDKKKS